MNGGPNPEGTNVGSYTDTSGVTHGFQLKKGVFTSFDPPGSNATTPSWISPRRTIVGGYVDSSGVNHDFVFQGGSFTTVDYPGAAGTILTSINPSFTAVDIAWPLVHSLLLIDVEPIRFTFRITNTLKITLDVNVPQAP